MRRWRTSAMQASDLSRVITRFPQTLFARPDHPCRSLDPHLRRNWTILDGRIDMLFHREITPCFKCRCCRAILALGARHCPYCESEIDQERAQNEAIAYVTTTKAIQSADAITNRDLVILLFIFYTFWMRWSGREAFYDVSRGWLWAEVIFAVGWLVPIVAITRWFYLHGKLTTEDEEYLIARKEVRRSLRLWIAAQVFHLLLVVAYP